MRQTLTPFLLWLALLATGCFFFHDLRAARHHDQRIWAGRFAAAIAGDGYHSSHELFGVLQPHTEDLLYKSEGGGGPFRANVLVTYEAYAANGSSYHWTVLPRRVRSRR